VPVTVILRCFAIIPLLFLHGHQEKCIDLRNKMSRPAIPSLRERNDRYSCSYSQRDSHILKNPTPWSSTQSSYLIIHRRSRHVEMGFCLRCFVGCLPPSKISCVLSQGCIKKVDKVLPASWQWLKKHLLPYQLSTRDHTCTCTKICLPRTKWYSRGAVRSRKIRQKSGTFIAIYFLVGRYLTISSLVIVNPLSVPIIQDTRSSFGSSLVRYILKSLN
jgi:hypothetical protein